MSKRNLLNRRNFMIGSGLIGFGALATLSFEEPIKLKAPYPIIADFPKKTMVLTYSSCYVPKIKQISEGLETSLKIARNRSKVLEAYTRAITETEDYCNSLPEELNSEQKQKLSRYINSGEDLELRLTSMSSSLLGEHIEKRIYVAKEAESEFQASMFFNKVSEDDKKRYKDLEEHSRKLFKKMTGREPPSLSISLEDALDNGCVEYYDFSNKMMVVEKAGYPKTLLAQIHGRGHSISQISDQELNEAYNNGNLEFIVEEEKGPYALEIASSYYEENEELSELMKMLMLIYVEDHVQGFFEGGERHNNKNLLIADTAVAIADATITYFQDPKHNPKPDPKQAYEYLVITPYDKIKPEIWDIIEENKTQYLRKKRLVKEVNKANSKVDENLEKLRKRFENVLKNAREIQGS